MEKKLSETYYEQIHYWWRVLMGTPPREFPIINGGNEIHQAISIGLLVKTLGLITKNIWY